MTARARLGKQMLRPTSPLARRARRARLLASLAAAALLVPAAMAATPVQAQVRHAVTIAAGPLDAALMTLAAQTHEQLLFTPDLVAGKRAPALHGELTAEEALAQLLAGADIAVTRAGPDVLVLRAVAAKPLPAAATTLAAEPPQEAAGGRPFASDPALAATSSAPASLDAKPAAAATVSEVEVTGSHIRGETPASPLLVITQDDLLRSGQSTVAAALEALPQNFGGGAAEGNNTTGADKEPRNPNFGSALNLRGLGNNATLVLVDGHRMSGSGSFGDFNDVSSIPVSAVERVEVLLDGASAIYGSDAVGGVVNIILRKHFDGAETRLETGAATDGEPSEVQVSQLLGKRWDTGGVLFSYEYQQRSALPGADRPFAANANLTSLGGSDERIIQAFPGNILVSGAGGLVPGFAIPAGQTGVGLLPSQLQAGVVNLQNQRLGIDILPNQVLNTFYLAADQEVGDRLELSADARYSQRQFRVHEADPTSNFTVTRANPFFVSPTGGASDTVAYSFADDLPNPLTTGAVETLGFTLDAKLRLFGDWRAEGFLTSARDRESNTETGQLNTTFLAEALGNSAANPATGYNPVTEGYFNPFTGVPGSNSAAVDKFIGSGFSSNYIRGEVTSANLQADGTVWTLPGGPLKLAVGAQVRRETLAVTGTNFISTVTPVPQEPSNTSRDVTAAYAEAQIPLFGPDNARPGLERLDLSIAGRVERYSDVGSTANPKFGLNWQPTSWIQARTAFGTSFRAPALTEVDQTAAFAPILLPDGAARVESLLLVGGNPTLRPETATSWTAGVDIKPPSAPGLTLGLTWFDIKYRNRIGQPVAADIATALSDPSVASFVTHISPTTNAADLALITSLLSNPAALASAVSLGPTAYGAIIDDRYVNTTTLIVRGLDLAGGYRFNIGGDKISLAGNATYTLDYDQQITPTSAVINEVGIASYPVPFRSRLTADWTRGPVTAGVAFNYISAYRDLLGVHIGDQPTADLQLRLAPPETGPMRGVAMTFNVRNVFNRAPPFYNNVVGIGYDPTNADPIGRFVSVQLLRAW